MVPSNSIKIPHRLYNLDEISGFLSARWVSLSRRSYVSAKTNHTKKSYRMTATTMAMGCDAALKFIEDFSRSQFDAFDGTALAFLAGMLREKHKFMGNRREFFWLLFFLRPGSSRAQWRAREKPRLPISCCLNAHSVVYASLLVFALRL